MLYSLPSKVVTGMSRILEKLLFKSSPFLFLNRNNKIDGTNIGKENIMNATIKNISNGSIPVDGLESQFYY